MKKFIVTLVLLVAVATVLYLLGLGPFKGDDAKGQSPRRGGADQAVTVKVTKVRLADVEETLTYVGSLLPNATVTVAPKTAGRVEKLFVVVGDKVKEGQILAQLEKNELLEDVREADASLRVSEANLKGRQAELRNLRRRLENARVLVKKDLIAREDVETLETQVLSAESQVELTKAQMMQAEARRDNVRIQLEHTDVRSPFAGYVSRRFVDRGALVSPNTPLVEIVDIGVVKVRIAVVEGDYRKVSVGQPVSIKVDAYPNRVFNGHITRMAPVLDLDTRTGEVEIELENATEELKPGMFARVAVVVEKQKEVLVVPEAARVKTVQGYAVFKLVDQEKKVERVAVKPGVVNDGWVAVEGELQPGDWVVTLGSSLLRDGQAVRVADEDGQAGQEGKRKGRRRDRKRRAGGQTVVPGEERPQR